MKIRLHTFLTRKGISCRQNHHLLQHGLDVPSRQYSVTIHPDLNVAKFSNTDPAKQNGLKEFSYVGKKTRRGF